MSAKAAVTAAMALRSTSACQKFTASAALRDDDPLYFGNDGDVEVKFDATRNCLVIDGEGQGVDIVSPCVRDRVQLVEKFEKIPQTVGSVAYTVNQSLLLQGTNASDLDITRHPEGGVNMETDGAAADSEILAPHSVGGLSAWNSLTWGTDRSVRWEAIVGTGTTAQSITSTCIWAGLKLTNTNVIATDADQAYFRYSAATGAYWEYVYSIGGFDFNATTGVAIAQNTVYHLVIDIDVNRIARFYIDGVLVATSAALTNAVDLIPFIGVVCEAAAAAARRVYVFQTSISRVSGAV